MSDTSAPSRSKAARYGASRQKVPPFARYQGTSAWHKDRRRVRAYARFLAETGRSKPGAGTPAT